MRRYPEGDSRDFYFDLDKLSLGVDLAHDHEAVRLADDLTTTIASAVDDVSRVHDLTWTVFMPDIALLARDVSKQTGLPASIANTRKRLTYNIISPFPPPDSHVMVINDVLFSGKEMDNALVSLWNRSIRGIVALSLFATPEARQQLNSYTVPLVTLSELDAEQLSQAS
jgi:hypothetical protein